MKKTILAFLFLAVAMFACKKKPTEDTTPLPSFSEFKLELSKNSNLTSDVAAVITGDSLVFTVPEGTLLDKSVISYITIAKSVKVNEVEQQSGVTVVNITNGTSYNLVSETGKTRSYTVYIKTIPATMPVLTVFKIEQKNNTELPADITFTFIGDSIVGVCPITSYKFKATFETVNTKMVQVGTEEHKSEITIADFNTPVTYTLTSTTGNKKNYVVVLKKYADVMPVLTGFKIEKGINTSITNDIVFTFKGDSILGKSPVAIHKYKPSFTTNNLTQDVLIGTDKQTTAVTEVDFTNPVTYTLVSPQGYKKTYIVKLTTPAAITGVPEIRITTNGGVGITSTDVYVSGTIDIKGNGGYDDYTGTTEIRGRGNSTWGMPKKPYRIKLTTGAGLLGLQSDRDWVLMANYIDGTLMMNAVAFKTAELLNMDYYNHAVPVDLYINGTYMGSYLFTEQVEADKARVNVKDGGSLFEMDSYFDDTYKFKSVPYDLPVQIKYPEVKTQIEVDSLASDFNAVVANFDRNQQSSTFAGLFDLDAAANFILVDMITDNEEINHPKSTFIHKYKGGKYMMGPVWDYDWAFGYEATGKHFDLTSSGSTYPFFWKKYTPEKVGTTFFKRLTGNTIVKNALKTKWADFKANKLPLLLQHIDNYSTILKDSKAKDYAKWAKGKPTSAQDAADMKAWLNKRATYLDTYIGSL